MDDLLKRAAGLARAHLRLVETRAPLGSDGPDRFEPRLASRYGFDAAMDAGAVLDDVARMLARGTAHGGHPRYFGPFHPGVDPVAIAATTLLDAANPQPAVTGHAAAAVALEAHTLRALRRTLGLPADGPSRFTGGASESLLDALVGALHARSPDVRRDGVRALPAAPRIYASREAHHALEKACRAAGLGDATVVRVETDARRRLDPHALAEAIGRDRRDGLMPLALVVTAGTTTTGAIDPIRACLDVARREDLHLHVDAASGGLLALSGRHAAALDGLDGADSIAWDGHKLLPLPMGTGMLFRRRDDGVAAAYAVESPYVPDDEPYGRGLPWSRRANGVPVFVLLATHGLKGLAAYVEAIVERGSALAARFDARGLRRLGGSALPVVAVVPATAEGFLPRDASARIERAARAGCFLAPVRLDTGLVALRAVVTTPTTTDADLDALVTAVADPA